MLYLLCFLLGNVLCLELRCGAFREKFRQHNYMDSEKASLLFLTIYAGQILAFTFNTGLFLLSTSTKFGFVFAISALTTTFIPASYTVTTPHSFVTWVCISIIITITFRDIKHYQKYMYFFWLSFSRILAELPPVNWECSWMFTLGGSKKW